MQLKDVTPIIKAILEERDKTPRIIDHERYIPNPQPYHDGNFMRGGIRKALRAIEQAPVVDAVPVVRCRECKYARPLVQEEWVACIMWCRGSLVDGFCHMGAKKDGGASDGSDA